MLAFLNTVSTPTIIVSGVVIFMANMAACRWFLGKIQSEPADETDPEEEFDDAETVVPDSMVRAGVPRSRPIQPVAPPPAETSSPVRLTSMAEPLASESIISATAGAVAPTLPVTPPASADLIAAPARPAAAPAPTPAPIPAPAIPAPAPITLTRMTTSSAPAPTASLTALPAEKAEAVGESARKFAEAAPLGSPLFGSPEKGPTSDRPAEIPPILPPLNFTKRIPNDRPATPPILETARPASADLIVTPKVPAASAPPTPVEIPPVPSFTSPIAAAAPPAADLISVDKPAVPLSSVTPDLKELASEPKSGSPDALAKEMSISNPTEPSKPAGADLIAIAPAASVEKPAEPAATAEKPATSEALPEGGGLILIPSSPTASQVTPAADKPTIAPGSTAPSSWKTRLLGRPRIFLPTGTGTGAAPAESEATPSKPEPVEAKAEPAKPELPKELEIVPPVEADKEPAVKAEADIPAPVEPPKAEAPLKAEEPASEPVRDAPPSAGLIASPSAGLIAAASAGLMALPSADLVMSPKEPSEAKEASVVSEPEPTASLVQLKGEDPAYAPIPSDVVEPVSQPSIDLAPPAEPPVEAKTPEPEPEAKKPEAKEPEAKEPEAVVAEPEPVVPEPEPVVASHPEPTPSADLAPLAPIEPEPTPEPEAKADLILPAAALAESATAEEPSEEPAAAPNLPVPIHQPVMNQKESTVATPAGGRASAQITLGFEITSLQLTPFFKLGAVQLRSLSNVVQLHLIASQAAENPLAAGISFQIESVDLDDSSHIKSILLKPLGQSQPGTIPQPKLQVENVKLGTGNEGAIEITSSQQTSTAVQMLATFTIAAMDFTPSFEIGSLRLEPNSNSVMLRLAPSSRPAALDLPPSFEVATVQLEGNAQLATVRLVPSGSK